MLRSSATLLGCWVVLAGAPSLSAAQPNESLKRLERAMTSWTSYEFTVRSEASGRAEVAGRNPPDRITRAHYVQTAKGQRLLEETVLSTAPDVTNRYFDDGAQCVDLVVSGGPASRVTLATIKREFHREANRFLHEAPLPFGLLYLEQQPIFQRLAKLAASGADRRIGRECDVFIVENTTYFVKKGRLTLLLDRESGFPLEVAFHEQNAPKDPARLLWKWTCAELGRESDFSYPRISMLSQYTKDAKTGNLEQLFRESRWTVEEFHLNRPYPDSMFRPVIPPGSRVVDEIRKRNELTCNPACPRTGPPEDATRPRHRPPSPSTDFPIVQDQRRRLGPSPTHSPFWEWPSGWP